MQVSSIDYNDYVGRIGIGRVFRVTLTSNKPVSLIRREGQQEIVRLKKLFTFEGLDRSEVEHVNVVTYAIVGIPDIDIGDCLGDEEESESLPPIKIDEPTLSMTFSVNDSPFYGQDGEFVTSRHLRDRLMKEKQNVMLHYT